MWFAGHPASLATHLYIEINSKSIHDIAPLAKRTEISTDLHALLIKK